MPAHEERIDTWRQAELIELAGLLARKSEAIRTFAIYIRMTKNKKITSYIPDLIFLLLIAAFGFWVNRDIVIKGLYMDDLYMWSCYGEQSLAEFVFPIGTSTRFRPVYWFATYLQMMIVGNHITRFVSFNIVVNVLTAYFLYYIARRLSDCRISSLAVGICYLASRFAYYQIGQALGLMETMALLLAIAMLWQLYSYMKDGRKVHYIAALALYFLVVFTHERYLCLFPLIYLALIVRMVRAEGADQINTTLNVDTGIDAKGDTGTGYVADAETGSRQDAETRAEADTGTMAETVDETGSQYTEKQSRGSRRAGFFHYIIPAAELALIIGIRCYAIGKALPAGTGGTEVSDTFSLRQTLGYCIDQVKYIFGMNAGPEYLNGIPWEQTPSYIRGIVYISIVLICIAALIYIVDILRRCNCDRRSLTEAVTDGMLFIGFIALSIACSSVTIRLEMRWIYVSYAAALLYAAYMIGHIRGIGTAKTIAAAAFIVYAVLSIYVNIFYRGYFTKIYFWANQLRMNSLAEQTVEKYGLDGILGKDIYIIGNSYEMTRFYADTFFKTFDPDMKAEGTTVVFAEGVDDIDTDKVKAGEAIVLCELPEDNAYLDVTEEIIGELG